jgi:hypothetical protein
MTKKEKTEMGYMKAALWEANRDASVWEDAFTEGLALIKELQPLTLDSIPHIDSSGEHKGCDCLSCRTIRFLHEHGEVGIYE